MILLMASHSRPALGDRKSCDTAYRACMGSSGRKSMTIVSGPMDRARANFS